MSIIEKTRIALLELFPEQAVADAEARAQAEAEASVAKEIDAVAAEMAAIKLSPDAASDLNEAVPDSQLDTSVSGKKESATKAETEEDGPRVNGVLSTDYSARGTHIDVLCNPDQVVDAASIMDGAGFFLESISGVDWIKDDKLEVIYDYNQYGSEPCRVVVRALIDRADPKIATISEVYPAADWHERETFDFYGVLFQGHPNLIPILLPEDADFHPLLKDFKP